MYLKLSDIIYSQTFERPRYISTYIIAYVAVQYWPQHPRGTSHRDTRSYLIIYDNWVKGDESVGTRDVSLKEYRRSRIRIEIYKILQEFKHGYRWARDHGFL